jgi:hypothetical protein
MTIKRTIMTLILGLGVIGLIPPSAVQSQENAVVTGRITGATQGSRQPGHYPQAKPKQMTTGKAQPRKSRNR